MTKEEREKILNDYCVKTNGNISNFDRYADLVDWENKARYFGLNKFYGFNDGKKCIMDNPWGQVFNSVDEFEDFLNDEPAPSGNKFKVGENEVIHITTEKEAREVFEIAGLDEINRFLDSDFPIWGYVEITNIAPFGWYRYSQSNVPFSMKIIPASEFIKAHGKSVNQKDKGKELEELLINKKPITYEEAYKICIDKMYKTPLNTSDITLKANPLQELTCKKQKKQLDLSTKKVRREF